MFTPGLIEFYNKVKESKNIEVVFCSLDNDEDQYKEYTSKMPWLSMPFDAKETKAMARTYNARGIPHLVVVDGETFEVVTYDGTEGLRENEDNFPWKPKTFAEVWPEKVNDNFNDDYNPLLDCLYMPSRFLFFSYPAHNIGVGK